MKKRWYAINYLRWVLLFTIAMNAATGLACTYGIDMVYAAISVAVILAAYEYLGASILWGWKSRPTIIMPAPKGRREGESL